MKTSIVAQNGSLHFEENEDIEIFEINITAKNAKVAIGVIYKHFPISSKIIAIHAIGKNTIASQVIYLTLMGEKYNTGNIFYEGVLLGNNFAFQGMTDINWLIRQNDFYDFEMKHPENHFRIGIDATSAFTGNLRLFIYVTGHR